MIDIEQFKGHTPGPWSHPRHGEFNVVGADKRRTVCSTGGYSESGNVEKVYNENLANARLIASAPDLLAEVVRLRAALKYYAELFCEGVEGGCGKLSYNDCSGCFAAKVLDVTT